MMEGKKILLSGIKPTGRLHIGNYLGMIKQLVTMQDKYFVHAFVADYHALTTLHNKDELHEKILGTAIDYIAAGLDPNKVLLFKQSDVPAHTELAWIFNSITMMPVLMRAHAFKDAQAKSREITVGSFDYPMLMAADILLYNPDVVPVGKDQKQHLEITRDTAEKFNKLFGETFNLPEPLIREDVAVIPGVDGQKMSKSYNNTIPLFAENDEIENAVMSIVTDSKDVGEIKDHESDNIFALHKFFSEKELPDLLKRYREGGIGYKESKEILIENLKAFISPMREKRKELLKDKNQILHILRKGGEIAIERSEEKMKEVREKIGVTLY